MANGCQSAPVLSDNAACTKELRGLEGLVPWKRQSERLGGLRFGGKVMNPGSIA